MTTTSLPEPVLLPCDPEIGADFQLREAVIRGLRCSGYRSLANLQCDVHGGIVSVAGIVPSYFLKQIAQTIILRMKHVKGMENHLQVEIIEEQLSAVV